LDCFGGSVVVFLGSIERSKHFQGILKVDMMIGTKKRMAVVLG
jgi:hypothetical protein